MNDGGADVDPSRQRPLHLEAHGVVLRPVAPGDLPSLRRWRNSDAVSRQMVDTRRIGAAQQRRWFEAIASNPSQQHWTIDCQGRRSGYANLKGRDAARPLAGQTVAETGLYLGDTPARRQGHLGLAAALAQLDCAFERYGIGRIETQVRRENAVALRFNSALGYEIVAEDAAFTTQALELPRYRAARRRLAPLVTGN